MAKNLYTYGMSTWSSRRKSRIAWTIIVVVMVLVVGGYFFFFYKTPTCFDSVQNGNELGIDCGGSCVKLCQSAYLPARIEWGGAKFEKIGSNLYNLGALVANPNTNAAAQNAPYRFAVYDTRGLLIIERRGTMNIPAHRNVLVFESGVDMGKRIPAKATFEFTSAPVWFSSEDTLGGLAIADKKYNEDTAGSSLQVTLQNRSQVPIQNITVGVVLFDINGNAIGFSKTIVDSLAPNGGQDIAPFTWPVTRNGQVVSIEAFPTVPPVRK
jgi:hypothetical protein